MLKAVSCVVITKSSYWVRKNFKGGKYIWFRISFLKLSYDTDMYSESNNLKSVAKKISKQRQSKEVQFVVIKRKNIFKQKNIFE